MVEAYAGRAYFAINKLKDGAIRFHVPTPRHWSFEHKYFETDLENFSKIFIK